MIKLTGIHGTRGTATAQIIVSDSENESTWFVAGQNPVGTDGYEITNIDFLNCEVHFENESSVKLHQSLKG